MLDMLERKTLFHGMDPRTGQYSHEAHLAEISALLGPSPEALRRKGEDTPMFYTSEGAVSKLDCGLLIL